MCMSVRMSVCLFVCLSVGWLELPVLAILCDRTSEVLEGLSETDQAKEMKETKRREIESLAPAREKGERGEEEKKREIMAYLHYRPQVRRPGT
ncbi:hypothetical protein F5Y14DRAFT_144799 [Nemania sp. NC0429]|nr:hypothetical protein F5Y14DRAFT_144799 [Nemania sp. NC0429]